MIFTTEQGKFLTADSEALDYVKKELINWSGMVEVLVRRPQRTKKQNNAIHGFFKDFATELEALGIEYKMGNIKVSWNAQKAKEFFVLAYLDGKRTSQTTTAELSNAIKKCIEDMTERGGQIGIKENTDDLSVSDVRRILSS